MVVERGGAALLRWIAVGAAISCASAAYQVAAIHLSSYLFPIHMLESLSLVLGAAIFFTGLGSLASRRLERRVGAVGAVGAALVPISIAVLFAVERSNVASSVPWVGVAAAAGVVAAPSAVFGAVTGACYIAVVRENRRAVWKLVAAAAAAFFAGYLGSSLGVRAVGPFGLAALAAVLCLAALPRRPVRVAAAAAAALAVLPMDCGDAIVDSIGKEPRLWRGLEVEGEPRRVGGGWSPYARVDLYEVREGVLAGCYNGLQQWVVSPSKGTNFDVREAMYERLDGDVLIIGSGGGQGVQALGEGASATAVELDPVVVEAMTGDLARYNGGAYVRDGVEVRAADGRSVLESDSEKWDTIVYEGADANVSHRQRSLIGMESYLYTAEGLAAADARLEEGGSLLFFLAAGWDFVHKVISGLPDGMQTGTWSVTAHGLIDFDFQLVIASRSREALDGWADLVAGSGLEARKRTDRRLLSRARAEAVEPAIDDRPIIYEESLAQAVPLAAAFCLLVAVLALSVALGRQRRLSTYFSLIGAAFMMTELFVVNGLRAFLGGYVETAAVSLGAISIAYVAGNRLADRVGRLGWAVLTAAAFLLLFALVHLAPHGAHLALRIPWVVAACAPAGLAMGIFMPRGMVLAEEGGAGRLFAADTVGSAVGFVAFYLFLLVAGISAAAAVALVLYFVAFAVFGRGVPR